MNKLKKIYKKIKDKLKSVLLVKIETQNNHYHISQYETPVSLFLAKDFFITHQDAIVDIIKNDNASSAVDFNNIESRNIVNNLENYYKILIEPNKNKLIALHKFVQDNNLQKTLRACSVGINSYILAETDTLKLKSYVINTIVYKYKQSIFEVRNKPAETADLIIFYLYVYGYIGEK